MRGRVARTVYGSREARLALVGGGAAVPPVKPRYEPGDLSTASVLDVLAYAIVRQDEGEPGWDWRAEEMRGMVLDHFGPVDGPRLVRGAEAMADQKRGVVNRHLRDDLEHGDPLVDVRLEDLVGPPRSYRKERIA